ncbi:Succinyl-CoA synthetase, beta subunit [Archaeoglobus sulfaticallidus PM70-1]|uniref:Succinyl-CoA synthetase, beta subunit n=1 Tax=Archaeoglobus sulfaticallidus PM70-1 TaxID=387631 RepID=N0BBB9_9EURY|nr:ATP-grasp domain-containing protein [Archaeoglobus sulfaticallidus]AGK60899.1 Succinyl-CoA synthetase, beta subunit [Archaeoglobus sulfaticallidus PM70-1]
MVKLYEYQGKELLKKEGIKVPEFFVAENIEQLKEFAEKMNPPFVLKAQLLISGRMKAGAVKFASNIREVEEYGRELFERQFKGFKAKKVLIEQAVSGEEYYASIIVNPAYNVKAPEILFSPYGGIDVEEHEVFRFVVDYKKGFDKTRFMDLIDGQVGDPEAVADFLEKLYSVFVKADARIVEVNPLFSPQMIAGDCKITVDDSSVFRHPEFDIDLPRDMDRNPTDLERVAWEIEEGDYRGTAYFVQLNTDCKDKKKGYIAFHGIGGGASMLSADAMIRKGLVLANYADSSGNPPASKIYKLIKVIMAQEGIEGYVLAGSVFASQEQWHHAHAVVKAFRELENKLGEGFPIVILLAGNKEKESHEILKEGLSKTKFRFEIYGRDYIYDPDFIADRVIKLVEEYRGG